MKIPTSIALIVLALAGCIGTFRDDPFDSDREVELDFDTWSAPLSAVSPMFDVRIPHFEAEGISRQAALRELESAWRTQSETQALPVSLSAVPENPERNITLSAADLTVRELLYIIAELSGATYIDGRLCGSIRVKNKTGSALSAPDFPRFKHLLIFEGFKKEEMHNIPLHGTRGDARP